MIEIFHLFITLILHPGAVTYGARLGAYLPPPPHTQKNIFPHPHPHPHPPTHPPTHTHTLLRSSKKKRSKEKKKGCFKSEAIKRLSPSQNVTVYPF